MKKTKIIISKQVHYEEEFLQSSVRITAIVLLFIVALNALAAGYSFITDPSGNGVGISTDYLKSSAPFKNYFFPGIVLFTVNGVLSIVVAVWSLRRKNHYPLFILIQGCILIGWIIIQLMVVKSFHPLHLIIGVIGIILMTIGWF